MAVVAEAGAGTTLVCLHGFLGDPEEWQPVADHLDPELQVLAPALPGHDGAAPGADDFQALVNALWTRLEPKLPPRFALVGYSLGGRLALALAARYPQRLSALILEGAHPGLTSEPEREQRRRDDGAWADRFVNSPWLEVLDAWYRQPVFADLSEARRHELIQRRSRHNPKHLAATLRAASLADQPDLRPALQALDVPVAYISGARDQKFSAIADMLAEGTPNLQSFKLAGVGHNCHAEAPEAVAAIINQTCKQS